MQAPQPLAKKGIFSKLCLCVAQTKTAQNCQQMFFRNTKSLAARQQTSFVIDFLFTAKCASFIKLGLNLDSLSKHAVATAWGKSLSQTQQVWDK